MADPKLKVTLEVDDKGSVKIRRFGQTVDVAGGKGAVFAKGIGSAAKGVASLAGQAALAVGKITALGGVLAAGLGAVALKKSISEFASFEKELANVSTLVDTGKVNIAALKNEIMALPPELGSATELTKGLYQAISAGVEPAKAVAFVAESAKAAKAGLSDTFTAVDAGTGIINAFGMSIKDAGSVFDQMFTAVKEGKTTFPELAANIGKIASTASNAGVSTQELFAAIATLTKGSIATAEATTYLRSAINAVIKPSSDAAKLAGELGLQFNLTSLKAQGLHGFLQMVKDATGGNVEQMARLFGGAEALSSILALTGSQSEEFTRILGSMKNAAGATDEAFAKQKETLSALWETFKNTVGKQAILIVYELAPAIKNLLEWLTVLMEKYRDPVTVWFAEAIGNIEINVRTLIPRIKEWAGVFMNDVIPAIRETISFIRDLIGWMSEIASKIANSSFAKNTYGLLSGDQQWVEDVIVEFKGEGSSVKPLSEKIDEMTGRLDSFQSEIGAMNPEVLVSFDTSGAYNSAIDLSNAVSSLKPTMTVGISAEAAQAAVNDFQSQLLALEKEIYQDRMDIESLRTYSGPMKSTFETLTDAELKEHMAQRTALIGQHNRVMTQLGYVPSYASGTGPAGLPHTGLFMGHKGEIVKNPAESAAERRGGSSLNVTFAPMFMTGDRSTMREAALVLKEEFDRLEKRYG